MSYRIYHSNFIKRTTTTRNKYNTMGSKKSVAPSFGLTATAITEPIFFPFIIEKGYRAFNVGARTRIKRMNQIIYTFHIFHLYLRCLSFMNHEYIHIIIMSSISMGISHICSTHTLRHSDTLRSLSFGMAQHRYCDCVPFFTAYILLLV